MKHEPRIGFSTSTGRIYAYTDSVDMSVVTVTGDEATGSVCQGQNITVSDDKTDVTDDCVAAVISHLLHNADVSDGEGVMLTVGMNGKTYTLEAFEGEV